MIENFIVTEKNIDEMHVQSEGRPSNVKPYRHPHYQETFQGRQEGQYQHYEGRRWNTNIVNIHGTRYHQMLSPNIGSLPLNWGILY
jgi:hypothetical protein